jgi:hypothetical protein
MENKKVAENTYPPLFPFFPSEVAIKISTIKINHTRKRYFDRLYLNILIIGHPKRITPTAKRSIQLSLFIY